MVSTARRRCASVGAARPAVGSALATGCPLATGRVRGGTAPSTGTPVRGGATRGRVGQGGPIQGGPIQGGAVWSRSVEPGPVGAWTGRARAAGGRLVGAGHPAGRGYRARGPAGNRSAGTGAGLWPCRGYPTAHDRLLGAGDLGPRHAVTARAGAARRVGWQVATGHVAVGRAGWARRAGDRSAWGYLRVAAHRRWPGCPARSYRRLAGTAYRLLRAGRTGATPAYLPLRRLVAPCLDRSRPTGTASGRRYLPGYRLTGRRGTAYPPHRDEPAARRHSARRGALGWGWLGGRRHGRVCPGLAEPLATAPAATDAAHPGGGVGVVGPVPAGGPALPVGVACLGVLRSGHCSSSWLRSSTVLRSSPWLRSPAGPRSSVPSGAGPPRMTRRSRGSRSLTARSAPCAVGR